MKKGKPERKVMLTAAEVAEIYQITEKTVRRWHKEGTIPAAVAIGTVIRFDEEEVAAALKSASDVQPGPRVMVI